MVWLKLVHIAGLSVWVAGLLYLPALLAAHARVADQQDFARVRMASRFAYIGIMSPAACVAIAAGTALLIVADALHPWMFLKLAAVGLLVVGHVQYGQVLTILADAEEAPPALRLRLVAGIVVLAVAAILWLVLAKPSVPVAPLPDWLTEAGWLHRPASPPQAAPALPRS